MHLLYQRHARTYVVKMTAWQSQRRWHEGGHSTSITQENNSDLAPTEGFQSTRSGDLYHDDRMLFIGPFNAIPERRMRRPARNLKKRGGRFDRGSGSRIGHEYFSGPLLHRRGEW